MEAQNKAFSNQRQAENAFVDFTRPPEIGKVVNFIGPSQEKKAATRLQWRGLFCYSICEPRLQPYAGGRVKQEKTLDKLFLKHRDNVTGPRAARPYLPIPYCKKQYFLHQWFLNVSAPQSTYFSPV